MLILGILMHQAHGLSQGEIIALDAFREAFPANPMKWMEPSAEACNVPFEGVECNTAQHVKGIYLANIPLSGSLPNEIGNFHWLEYLDLSVSSLYGSIPDVLHNWTMIETINLKSNGLTGLLPPSLCHDTLTSLRLGENALYGPILDCLGNLPNLTALRLASNNLNGSISASLRTSISLEVLDLTENRLIGSLPEFFESPNFHWLSLEANLLSGTLPASWERMKALNWLSIGTNELSGTIPAEWGALSNLVKLHVGRNRLEGTIPPELGNLTRLEHLWLHNNQLTSTIPGSFGQLRLQTLHLGYNPLTGTIPQEMAAMTTISEFYLKNSSFTGSIPAWLNTCTKLWFIDFSFNGFSGTIPPLDALENLRLLSLESNNLEGNFPRLSTSNTGLELNFAKNRLSGSLPSPASFSAQLNWLSFNVANNNFSGSIPPSFLQLVNLKSFFAGDNSLSGSIPLLSSKFAWNGVSGLNTLSVPGNRLSGPIPPLFGIQTLDLSRNDFSFRISSIPSMAGLVSLNLSQNRVVGSLEDFFSTDSRMQALESADFSHNRLSGVLPWMMIKNLFATGPLVYLSVVNNSGLVPEPDYQKVGLMPHRSGALKPMAGNASCLLLTFPGPGSTTFRYDDVLVDYGVCYCDPGFWGSPKVCSFCHSGTFCPGGASVEIGENYYPYIVGDPETGKLETELCLEEPDLIPRIWNPCQSKSLVRAQIVQQRDLCVNAAGRRCSHCECPLDHTQPCYFHRNFHCVRCASNISTTVLFASLVPAALIAACIFIGVFSYILVDQKKQKAWWKLKAKILLSHGLIKILISFVQFSLELIHWDIALRIGILGIVNLDATGFGPQCAFRALAHPNASFYLKSFAPFILVLAIWFLIGCSTLVSRWIINRRALEYKVTTLDHEYGENSDLDFSSEKDGEAPLLTSNDDQDKRELRTPLSLGVSATLTAIRLFYFGFSVSVVSAFISEKQDGTSTTFMTVHPYILWSDAWSTALRIWAPILLFFVFAIPAVQIMLLVKYRHKMQEITVFSHLSSLYRPFKPNRYWWDLILTARKFCIAAVLSVISADSPFRPWAVTVVISVCLLLQIYFDPWKRPIENYFENLSSVILISAYLSTWYKTDTDSTYNRALIATGRAVALGFIAVTFIIWIVSALREPLSSSDTLPRDSKPRRLEVEQEEYGTSQPLEVQAPNSLDNESESSSFTTSPYDFEGMERLNTTHYVASDSETEL